MPMAISPAELVALSDAGELGPSWAVRPIELIDRRGQAPPWMEDPGGQVLATLLGQAVLHSGAKRGLLIVRRAAGVRIEAEATTQPDTIVVRRLDAIPGPSDLPDTVLKYVLRTKESVMLDHASVRHPFSNDSYMIEHHVHSLLCLPLVKPGALIGALYLENRVAPHVFTPSRLPTLELLASQAAVSLENAQLYTELRQTQARLEERTRELAVAYEKLAHIARITTLGEMTASIAHELRQPLAAMVADADASLNWLAAPTPNLERACEALEAIVAEGHRAGDVIQHIRQLATRSGPQKVPVDVNDVIRDVVPLIDSAVRSHNVQLRLDLTPAPAPVAADRVQLQQVVINLGLNGIEAISTAHGRPRELVIRSQRRDGDVVVAVQDTGVGVDPDSVEELFSAFFTTKPGGMGMGLSISRSIIEQHGGRLWATANPRYGATFSFALTGLA
jgi:C4-dicarboxylate-specific signal transduction histidine kinase